MDSSKIRQIINELDIKRRKLIHQVVRPKRMVSGSLYKMHRRCGNARCKCTRGELHDSWYLSRSQEGKTKLTYIGKIVPEWFEKRVSRYQKHQNILSQIRKIDAEISKYLNQLRDEQLQSYEQAQKSSEDE